MATHDYVIDNSTGANVRADLNLVLQAILSNNSSSSAPSTTAAYMWWADTTSGTLKIRNSSDNAWVELLQLDGTLTLEDGSNSEPALAFRDDLDTGIYSSDANKFNVATGGVERMELGTTTIFNEDGADVDFRIEGDTEANLFYVDAGNERIGIGTSSPRRHFHIHESTSSTVGLMLTNGATGESNDSQGFQLKVGSDGTANIDQRENAAIKFGINGNDAMMIDNSRRLLIGHSSSLSIGSGDSLPLQVSSTNAPVFGGVRFVNSSSGPFLSLAKSRAASAGSNTIVQINDDLGTILFAGDDGTDLISKGASISAAVDGTPGSNDMPGRLVFGTTADGAVSPSERLRIDKNGHMGLGVTPDDGWPSNGDFRAFQLGTGACVFGRGSGDEDRGGLAVNYYATGSGNKFLANGHANLVYLNDGNIDFYTSAQNTSGADADLSLIHVMAIKPDKNVEIKDGNLIMGNDHGIDFSAAGGSASGSSNALLNDYEEGTWTPTIGYQNSTGLTIATNSHAGKYTKIGRLVMVIGCINFSVSGSPVNDNIFVIHLTNKTAKAAVSTGDTRFAGCNVRIENTSDNTSIYMVGSYGNFAFNLGVQQDMGNRANEIGGNSNMIVRVQVWYHTA